MQQDLGNTDKLIKSLQDELKVAQEKKMSID
jgi:hypothetical protein